MLLKSTRPRTPIERKSKQLRSRHTPSSRPEFVQAALGSQFAPDGAIPAWLSAAQAPFLRRIIKQTVPRQFQQTVWRAFRTSATIQEDGRRAHFRFYRPPSESKETAAQSPASSSSTQASASFSTETTDSTLGKDSTVKTGQQSEESGAEALVRTARAEISKLVAAGQSLHAVRFYEQLPARVREHPAIIEAHIQALVDATRAPTGATFTASAPYGASAASFSRPASSKTSASSGEKSRPSSGLFSFFRSSGNNQEKGNAGGNDTGDGMGYTSKQPIWVAMKPSPLSTLGTILTLILVVIFIFVLLRGNAMGGFMTKKYNPVEKVNVTFSDVMGNDEAKEELTDLVQFLRDPEAFRRQGIKVPKGVLLIGPPGTGKTLIARALAGEAGVPFISTSGSEFEEMFVGVGAKRVRSLFETARQKAPCIIFIDELDAVGSRRDDVNSKTKMTLNQLLVEMDGFSPAEGVIVIGATNMVDILDPALLRAGRFDRKVTVELPDLKARKMILDFYLKNKQSQGVSTDILARSTAGFSGADLETMVNWAAIEASKRFTSTISMDLLEQSILNVAVGRERKSMVLTEATKKLTAYHEAGHALVSLHTPGSHEIRKATLIPRGAALGLVNYLQHDNPFTTKKQLLAQMDTAMGGRAAEELIFGDENVTQGASNDFKQATQIATTMVTKYGMSPKIGHIHVESYPQRNEISGETKSNIETEVRMLLEDSFLRAKNILKANEKELHALAKGLIKYETLELEEIKRVLKGEELKDKMALMEKEKAESEQRRKDFLERNNPPLPSREELIARARQNLPNPNPQPAAIVTK